MGGMGGMGAPGASASPFGGRRESAVAKLPFGPFRTSANLLGFDLFGGKLSVGAIHSGSEGGHLGAASFLSWFPFWESFKGKTERKTTNVGCFNGSRTGGFSEMGEVFSCKGGHHLRAHPY